MRGLILTIESHIQVFSFYKGYLLHLFLQLLTFSCCICPLGGHYIDVVDPVKQIPQYMPLTKAQCSSHTPENHTASQIFMRCNRRHIKVLTLKFVYIYAAAH
jgi:hypothetical protein